MTPPPSSQHPLGAILLATPSQTSAGLDLLRSMAAERPLVAWALAALRDTQEIGEIALVVETWRMQESQALVASLSAAEARVTGVDGAGVGAALRTGLDALPATARWVVVLEATRPMVTPSLLAAGIAMIQSAPDLVAACAASPVKETIKRVRDGVVVETLDRSTLALLATPMVFDRGALEEACRINKGSSSLAELLRALRSAGGQLVTFSGGAENLVITTPHELALLDGPLRARRPM